jgi:hypothetical protein
MNEEDKIQECFANLLLFHRPAALQILILDRQKERLKTRKSYSKGIRRSGTVYDVYLYMCLMFISPATPVFVSKKCWNIFYKTKHRVGAATGVFFEKLWNSLDKTKHRVWGRLLEHSLQSKRNP